MHGSLVLPARPKVAEIASRFAGGGEAPLPKKEVQNASLLAKKEVPSQSKKSDLGRTSLSVTSASTKVSQGSTSSHPGKHESGAVTAAEAMSLRPRILCSSGLGGCAVMAVKTVSLLPPRLCHFDRRDLWPPKLLHCGSEAVPLRPPPLWPRHFSSHSLRVITVHQLH
jgi:hypothetical protein